jgi:hypothetical protein
MIPASNGKHGIARGMHPRQPQRLQAGGSPLAKTIEAQQRFAVAPRAQNPSRSLLEPRVGHLTTTTDSWSRHQGKMGYIWSNGQWIRPAALGYSSPIDTHQDLPVNSIETDVETVSGEQDSTESEEEVDVEMRGIDHYRQILEGQPDYPSIVASIEPYRKEPPPKHSGPPSKEEMGIYRVKLADLTVAKQDPELYSALLADVKATRARFVAEDLSDSIRIEDHKPVFGPPTPGIDYTIPPVPRSPHDKPTYKGVTDDPTVALAIIRVAEKNLPFVNFDSALSNLPTITPPVPPRRLPTETYPKNEYAAVLGDPDVARLARDPAAHHIHIALLPKRYKDGRHAIGFWTYKLPSMRYGAMVFTPCSARDLKAARLWQGPTGSRGPKEPKNPQHWEDVRVRAVDGQWWARETVGELCAPASLDAYHAEREWGLRLFATRSPENVTKYPGFSSMEERRDRERVWESWWN